MKIFSGLANRPLAMDIADYLNIPLGESEIIRFNDGEIKVKYNENIRGMDLFIIQPTFPPADHLMELLLLIDAAKRASAKRITAVIPYFGYARQDRKDQPRVALSAKLVANLITTAGADRVLTMDLHSASIQGFFDIPVDHLYASTIFVDHLKKIKLGNPMVVAPDIGSSKRAGAYAKRMGCELALVDKKRSEAGKIDQVTLIGDVMGTDVIIVDDIVDTAGTMCKGAALLKSEGASQIVAACTHPLLSGPAIENLKASCISKMLVTDTIPLPPEKKIDKIQVISSAGLFGEAIRRIHNEESISSLF
ncbi:ribose-phosphate pyrophosphokinase [bacterium]|nr:ribose-phosphate pyrophosphokinase [bacterium]